MMGLIYVNGDATTGRKILLQIHLLLAACSHIARAGTPRKIQLPGASGSGPYHVANAWATAFEALYPEVNITIGNVGSGLAQSALWGDVDCAQTPIEALCKNSDANGGGGSQVHGTTTWGMGEVCFEPSAFEEQRSLGLLQLPAFAGAVVVTHSRDVTGDLGTGLESGTVNMTFDVISGIFNGTIVHWDDPAIAALNPDLPHERISVIVRRDESGQSQIFSRALARSVPNWPTAAVGVLPQWPVDGLAHANEAGQLYAASSGNSSYNRHYFEADRKSGVAYGLFRIPYSIGYMDSGYYHGISDFVSQVGIASVSDPERFVPATTDSLQKAVDEFEEEAAGGCMTAALNTTGAYQITGYVYWYLSKNHLHFRSCYQAWLLCKFIKWSFTSAQAGRIALEYGWTRPPQSVVEKTLAALNEVQCIDKDGDTTSPISVLSYTPMKYQQNMNYYGAARIVTWSLAAIIGVASASFFTWTITKRNNPVVRASQPGFLVMICVGAFVMGSAIFPLGIDDSIASTRGCSIACMTWVWLLTCGFIISFSALFSKLHRINRLMKNSRQFRKINVKPKDVLIPFLVLFALNVVFLLAWTLTDPLKWKRIEIDDMNSYGACRADGKISLIFVSLIAATNLTALVLANVEAYRARNIADDLSETKYVVLTMASMLEVFVVGVPLIILVHKNTSAWLFVFSCVISVTALALLLLIFVPKQLLIRKKRKATKVSMVGHNPTQPAQDNSVPLEGATT